MNFEIANKGLLALFFLYLVMISGSISSLLNCGIQRFIQNNVAIRHIIVVSSIFIFTFILNWYTPSSLVLKENLKNKKDIKKNKYKYIIDSIKYTLLIYILFLLSSKQEKSFMFSFILLLILSIIIYIIYLVEIESLNLKTQDLNAYFISKKYISSIISDQTEANKIYILHNTLSTIYVIILFNLLFGVYFYILKQMKDKKNNFNLLIFIFGSNLCRGVAVGFDSSK